LVNEGSLLLLLLLLLSTIDALIQFPYTMPRADGSTMAQK
jgi:hypothetical protein